MAHIQKLDDPQVDKILKAAPKTVNINRQSFQTPFPSPSDWRDQWIYFMMVDRFNNPNADPVEVNPPLPYQPRYQGGNFEGIRQKLDYLEDLGVGAIWLSPVHFNPQWFKDYWGGYGIQDFLRIEPRFCKDPAAALKDPELANNEFRTLVDEIHSRGMYVVADIVLNHMGDLFNYEGVRDSREWNHEGTYRIFWRDENGIPHGEMPEIEGVPNLHRDAGPWPRELQRNDFFRRRGSGANDVPIRMGDFDRLKEIVTDYLDTGTGAYPVRDLLIRAYQYFISRFDIDAYRIDTLQYVDKTFARIFGNAMREHALSIGKKNFLCMGEVWQDDDESKIAEFIGRNSNTGHGIIGVDTAIDFPMRKRLVAVIKGWQAPAVLARQFENRQNILRTISSSHGDASAHYVTFLDNHDLDARFHTAGWAHQTTMALTCLFAMLGIPCVYYGTEQGLDGSGDRREYAREALWGAASFDQSHPFFRHIKGLSELRKAHPALRYGRQYFRPCSGDGIHFGHSEYEGGLIAVSRILNTTEILIVANTSTNEAQQLHVMVDRHLNADKRKYTILHTNRSPANPPQPVNNNGTVASLRVHLQPMEVQVLVGDDPN